MKAGLGASWVWRYSKSSLWLTPEQENSCKWAISGEIPGLLLLLQMRLCLRGVRFRFPHPKGFVSERRGLFGLQTHLTRWHCARRLRTQPGWTSDQAEPVEVFMCCVDTSDPAGGLQLPLHDLSMPQIRLHSEVGTMLTLSHVPLRVGWAPSDSSTDLGKQPVPCMEHTRWQHHTIYHHAISLGSTSISPL